STVGVQLASLDGSISKSIAKMTTDKSQLVLASVGEGRALRANVQALHIPLNSGFTANLVLAAATPVTKNLGDGLTLTIINPRKAELDALQTGWAKEIKEIVRAHV